MASTEPFADVGRGAGAGGTGVAPDPEGCDVETPSPGTHTNTNSGGDGQTTPRRVKIASPTTVNFISPTGVGAGVGANPGGTGGLGSPNIAPLARLTSGGVDAHQAAVPNNSLGAATHETTTPPHNPLIQWLTAMNAAEATPTSENGMLLEQMMQGRLPPVLPSPPGSDAGGEKLVERMPSMAKTLSRKGSAASLRAVSEKSVEEDLCPLCLCDLGDGRTALIEPCNHRYHDDCALTFFSKCAVRKCPICRDEIEGLRRQEPDGFLDRAAIEGMFIIPFAAVQFSSAPFTVTDPSPEGGGATQEVVSFFTSPSQVRDIVFEVADAERGLLRVVFPPIQLEVVDSQHNIQQHTADMTLSILHSTTVGKVEPAIASFIDGVCCIPRLVVEYMPEAQTQQLLALKFTVYNPGQPVHLKSVYAGVKVREVMLVHTRRFKIAAGSVVVMCCIAVVIALAVLKTNK